MDSAPEKITAFEKRLKRQVIGKPHRFLAVVPLGFEQTFVQEMFGSSQDSITYNINGDGKVEFTAKLVEAWKIVAFSRIANRVLMHIADFKAENFRDLEKKSADIPWELFLPNERHVDIHVTCKHSRLYHSDAVAERLYKVIDGGSREEPRNAPPQQIYVTLIADRCTLWLDLAGEELYKRGHERFVNDAPLKETIAAAMIFEAISTLHTTHPTSHITLIDPMAGSGTFSLEAAYMAGGLIPGKCRDFALMHQPAFKPATWNHIVNSAPSSREFNILPSDISRKAVEIIRHNVASSPIAHPKNQKTSISPTIDPQLRDFFDYTAKEIADACPGEASPVIVLNPPYGKRLDFDAPGLYTKIGKKLAELARDLSPLGKKLTVAILAPEDAPASRYTCTANLLRECPSLDPDKNSDAKSIVTSHGGIGLNAFFAAF